MVTKKIAHIYNDLFERRQEGDYEDFFIFEESDVKRWIGDAEIFVASIQELLKK